MSRISIVLAAASLLLLLAVLTAVATSGQEEREFVSEEGSHPESGDSNEKNENEDDDDDDVSENELLRRNFPDIPLKKVMTCPDPDAPKIGDTIYIHIPSRDHLIPRFPGLRVFTPPHPDHPYVSTGHQIMDHHHNSKILYVFPEHAIQGVWPVHAFAEREGRNLRFVIKDLVVKREVLPKSGVEEDLCFFKVQII